MDTESNEIFNANSAEYGVPYTYARANYVWRESQKVFDFAAKVWWPNAGWAVLWILNRSDRRIGIVMADPDRHLGPADPDPYLFQPYVKLN